MKETNVLYETVVALNTEKNVIELNNTANKKIIKLEEEIKEFTEAKKAEIQEVMNTEEYKNFTKQIEKQQEQIDNIQNQLADTLEANNRKSMHNIKITYSEKFDKERFIEENPDHPAITLTIGVDRKLLKKEYPEEAKKYTASERKIKYQEK